MSSLDPERDTLLLVNTGAHWVAFVRKDVDDSWKLHDNGKVYAAPDRFVAICVKMYNTTRSICGQYSVNIQPRHRHLYSHYTVKCMVSAVIILNVNRI